MPATRSGISSTLCALTAALLSTAAFATDFDVPSGSLEAALDVYSRQSGIQLMVPSDQVRSIHTGGVKGDLPATDALSRILSGTGFAARRDSSGVMGIVREVHSQSIVEPMQLAQAVPSRAAVETVTVTSSKLGGADVQSIPISITALSQEQLTATQTAGGPDLIKQVPNMTFTKTNFSGYSIQLRGIGTQAISVTTDPAVAVAFNDIPFIRNHFFEQEFYDVASVEVLRGPQGTLYGRNATAGVVNLSSAKPTDQFEAMASGELGSYHQRRFEGMINIPIVDDRLDLRVAGEWTKREGYSFNALTDSRIDGRDLWSGRVSLGWKPIENLRATLVWEHFSENDDRMRTAKQLCKTDPGPTEVGGVQVPPENSNVLFGSVAPYLTQGCLPTSLYSAQAFEVPNSYALPYAVAGIFARIVGDTGNLADAYLSATQSRNLRVIESALNPSYKAKNDIVELNADFDVTPSIALTSQTGFNQDFLWSTEDYNRFAARPNYFIQPNIGDVSTGQDAPVFSTLIKPNANGIGVCTETGCTNGLPGGASCSGGEAQNGCRSYGVFCDPQLGCNDRLMAQDLSDEHAWQFSQEIRVASKFAGPLNFSVGGNYLHYETEENYYVFANTITALAATPFYQSLRSLPPWEAGVSDNSQCLAASAGGAGKGKTFPDPNKLGGVLECGYIDPNPISSLNNQGHNYFLSQNPYLLDSYAAFGEVYYNLTSDLKLIGGLRWTDDKKHFVDIPSELLVSGYGYPITDVINQKWSELTGRAVVNWTPKLSFTDQTLVYASYSHGYKAGGANPPGAVLLDNTLNIGNLAGTGTNPIHPLTFKPEFIDAFELGSKNTLLDGALTLNADVFYYNYENYQISEIVDRTSINQNFDTHVKGAEAEATWEPLPGLRFNFSGGWEDTSIAKGAKAIDLMDRTAGNPDWVVVKPFITSASNCILPTYFVAEQVQTGQLFDLCTLAYVVHKVFGPVQDYPGFDPVSSTATNNGAGPAPNNGEGFDKDLGGNELPNAPPFTVSFGTQYTLPITQDWAGTARADYYWQDYSWARVFNDNPYDRLRGYTNVNLTLIFTNQNGWQVMLYDKNVFNTTAITGDFLNSDDSGLTTNVFLTDPKLIGIRVTKNW